MSETAVGPLQWLKLGGPRRNVFRWMGERFRDVITDFLEQPAQREGAARARKSPHLATVLDATRRFFPEAISELNAVGEGAGVPAEELLLLNVRGDLGYQSEGCSTLGLHDHNKLLLVHNEDADPVHAGDCPLLTLHIDGEPPLATYWYPGMLVAMTFWLNGFGLGCGIDHVPVADPGPGVGRQFLARRQSSTRSVDEFIDRASRIDVAGGYTYMVGSTAERRLVTVEVGPGGVAVEEVSGRYVHTNHFLRLSDRQVIDDQSRPRLDILETVGEAITREAALRAFTDQSGGIWRDATGDDPLLTLCSVVFDFDARVLTLQPRGSGATYDVDFEALLSAP